MLDSAIHWIVFFETFIKLGKKQRNFVFPTKQSGQSSIYKYQTYLYVIMISGKFYEGFKRSLSSGWRYPPFEQPALDPLNLTSKILVDENNHNYLYDKLSTTFGNWVQVMCLYVIGKLSLLPCRGNKCA